MSTNSNAADDDDREAMAEDLYLILDRENGHTSWGTCPERLKHYWRNVADDLIKLQSERVRLRDIPSRNELAEMTAKYHEACALVNRNAKSGYDWADRALKAERERDEARDTDGYVCAMRYVAMIDAAQAEAARLREALNVALCFAIKVRAEAGHPLMDTADLMVDALNEALAPAADAKPEGDR